MDLLFDLVFPVQGGDLPVKLKFNDIIFVMEDVDAASKVVYARAGSKKAPKAKGGKKQAKAKAKVATLSGDGIGGDDAKGKAETEPAKQGEEASTTPAAQDGKDRTPPPAMPTLLRMISARSSVEEEDPPKDDKVEEEDEDVEEDEEERPESPKKGGSDELVKELIGAMMAGGGDGNASGSEDKKGGFSVPWKSKFSYEGEDDLNLAGLLNVLDGVVDSPGRIVVMTTNHPDKLDPALIRPGRINKRIHLGFVNGKSVCAMAEHYMQVKLTDRERSQLEAVTAQRSVTPAQVEQCCAESEDIEALTALLHDLQ